MRSGGGSRRAGFGPRWSGSPAGSRAMMSGSAGNSRRGTYRCLVRETTRAESATAMRSPPTRIRAGRGLVVHFHFHFAVVGVDLALDAAPDQAGAEQAENPQQDH